VVFFKRSLKSISQERIIFDVNAWVDTINSSGAISELPSEGCVGRKYTVTTPDVGPISIVYNQLAYHGLVDVIWSIIMKSRS